MKKQTSDPITDLEDTLQPGEDIGDGEFQDGISDEGGVTDVLLTTDSP